MSDLRKNYSQVSLTEIPTLIRTLTDNGLLSGSALSNVDGSATPVEFWIEPSFGSLSGNELEFELFSITVQLTSAGNNAVTSYGGLPELTNGVQFFVERDGVQSPFGPPFISNENLVTLGQQVTRVDYSGNVQIETYSFNTKTHAEVGIKLRIRNGVPEKFGYVVQDNLTALLAHRVIVRGSIKIGEIVT